MSLETCQENPPGSRWREKVWCRKPSLLASRLKIFFFFFELREAYRATSTKDVKPIRRCQRTKTRGQVRSPRRAGMGAPRHPSPEERRARGLGGAGADLPPAWPPGARHLSQHFAPAVALPRRRVDDNPRDLRPRVRVVVMVVRGGRLHLRLGLLRLRLLGGLLRPLLLRVRAASLAKRLLAHLGAGGRLVSDSPQELHRRLAARHSLLSAPSTDSRPRMPSPSSPSRCPTRARSSIHLCECERPANSYIRAWGAEPRHGMRRHGRDSAHRPRERGAERVAEAQGARATAARAPAATGCPAAAHLVPSPRSSNAQILRI